MNAITELEQACEGLRRSIAETQQILDVKNAELRGLLRGLEALRAAQREIEEGFTALMLRPAQPPKRVDPANADPPAGRQPAAQPPVEAGTLADEVFSALATLIETYPKGPTVREIAAHLGEDEKLVRRACQTLANRQRATFMRRKDDGAYHLCPMGHTPVAEELSPRQTALLIALEQVADENRCVARSMKDLCELSGIHQGSFTYVMDALIRKGRVQLIERGVNNQPNTYRIVPAPGVATHERNPQ